MTRQQQAKPAPDGALPTQSTSRHLQSVEWLLFIAATACVTWLIWQRELWLDESHSVYAATRSWQEVVGFIVGDVHPPVYYTALHLWGKISGHHVWLRMLSGVTHILATVVFARFIRERFGDPLVATLAVVMYAFSPPMMFFASEARSYAMFLLAFVLLLQARFAAEDGRGSAAFAGAMGAWTFYHHYLAVFAVPAVMGAWATTRWRDGEQRRRILLATAVGIAIALPWVPTFLAQRAAKQAFVDAERAASMDPSALLVGSQMAQAPTPLAFAGQFIRDVLSLFGMFQAPSLIATILMAIPIIVVVAGACRLALRRDSIGLIFIWTFAMSAIGVIVLASPARRYMITLAPVYALAACAVVAALLRRRPRAGYLLAAALAVSTLAGGGRVAFREYPSQVVPLVASLARWTKPQDVLLFESPTGQLPFDYYSQHTGVERLRRGFPVTMYEWWESQPTKTWNTPVASRSDLETFVNGLVANRTSAREIWLIEFERDFVDPRGQLRTVLSERVGQAHECLVDGMRPGAQFRVFRFGRTSDGTCGARETDQNP